MDTEDLYRRGRSNIEDAHFIRANLIPEALQHEKWNLVVHQAFQAIELLLKGMTCLTGHKPAKDHNTQLLIDNLLNIVSSASPTRPHFPYSLFVSTTDGNNGYGIWMYDGFVELFRHLAGSVTSLGSKKISDLLNAVEILRLELDVRDLTVNLTLDGEQVFSQTDSALIGHFTLKRGFVREPSSKKMDLLREISRKLRSSRESSFYSERFYTQHQALEAIQLLDDANEAAAYFFVEVSIA